MTLAVSANSLPPAVLHGLSRSKLRVNFAHPVGGSGERRSRLKGLGMEFEDHRLYQPGDNVRHIDRNVYMRTGKHFVREYASYRQLEISVLVDASSSMLYGDPAKLTLAKRVALALAFTGLAGGDRILLGAVNGQGVKWHPALQGSQRIGTLQSWLGKLEGEGEASLSEVASSFGGRRQQGGLFIVISDFMANDVALAMSKLASIGLELVALQILAPQELDPRLLGEGESSLVDMETLEELPIPLGEDLYGQYDQELATWRDELKTAVHIHRGRLYQVRSDEPLEDLVLRRFRIEGLIE